MRKSIASGLVFVGVAFLTCAPDGALPKDSDLELFIEISSRCAYIDRAFSHDEALLEEEMARLDFPANWNDIVDTLLSRYGAEADFWYEIYTEISERSRR